MYQKLIAILLSAFLLLSCVPAAVFAEDIPTNDVPIEEEFDQDTIDYYDPDAETEQPNQNTASEGSAVEDETKQQDMQPSAEETAKAEFNITPEAEFLIDYLNLLDFSKIKGTDYVSYSAFYNSNAKLSGQSSVNAGNDNCVTFSFVIKELVTLLGYEEPAKVYGGYSYGYILEANHLKLLDGIQISNYSDFVDYDNYCRLLYNVLTCDLMKIASISTKDGVHYDNDYAAEKDETLLSMLFDIKVQDGVLTGTEKNDLYGSVMQEGFVKIDGTLYRSEGNPDFNLIGHHVVYFTKKSNSYDTVLFYCKDTENETVTTVYSTEIEGFDGTQFHYTPDNTEKEKSIALQKGTPILKNGIFYGNVGIGDTVPILNISRGNIEFIDNNSDGKIEYVSMIEYSIHVVDSVNTEKEIVYFKDDSPMISLGEDYANSDEGVYYSVTKNGNFITVSDIFEWDALVINYSVGTNGKEYYEIELVRKTVTGTVTEANLGEEEIYIDSIKHKIAPCLNTDSIKVGVYGIFIIAGNNEIAAVDSERDYKYGFLMGARLSADIAKTGMLQIKTESGRTQIYNLTEKVSYNDITRSSDFMINELCGKEMLLAYNENRNGEINQIYSAETVEKKESAFSLDADHSAEDKTITGSNRYTQYREDVFLYRKQFFNDLYSAANNCVVFYVDSTVTDFGKELTDEDILVGGANSIDTMINTTSSYESYVIRAKLYDTDDFYRAGAIVIYREDVNRHRVGQLYSSVIVIDSVSRTLIEGEDLCKVTYYQDGSTEKNNIYANPKKVIKDSGLDGYPFPYHDSVNTLDELQCGDIIQIAKDNQNHISSFRPIFLVNKTYNEGDYWGRVIYKYWSNFEVIYTKIQNVQNADYIAKVDGHDRYIMYTKADNAECFVYDKKAKKLTFYPDMSITNELVTGADVLMIRDNYKMQLQMIIK